MANPWLKSQMENSQGDNINDYVRIRPRYHDHLRWCHDMTNSVGYPWIPPTQNKEYVGQKWAQKRVNFKIYM